MAEKWIPAFAGMTIKEKRTQNGCHVGTMGILRVRVLAVFVVAAYMGLNLPVTISQADTDTFWILDPAVVHRLEAKIVMPEGAKPLGAFTRYYEPGFDHGRRTVFGLLTENGDKQIHISGRQPIVLDGGCSVVNLTFDVATGQVTSIKCNGFG